MKKLLTSALVFGALVAASPAYSCSVVVPEGYEGSAKQRRDVRKAIEQSSAVVDGEVVRPWTSTQPALVRVEHVLKGYPSEFIEVGGPDAGKDCSIQLELGERSRMILWDGPNPYHLYRDQSEARIEDRILGSDRRKIWPYVQGTETAH